MKRFRDTKDGCAFLFLDINWVSFETDMEFGLTELSLIGDCCLSSVGFCIQARKSEL